MTFVHSPSAADEWTRWITASVEAALQRTQALREQIPTVPGDQVLERWNDLEIELADADALVSTLSEVHPNEAVRTACEDHAQAINKVRTEIGLDRSLFDALAASPSDGLDAEAARVREHTL